MEQAHPWDIQPNLLQAQQMQQAYQANQVQIPQSQRRSSSGNQAEPSARISSGGKFKKSKRYRKSKTHKKSKKRKLRR